jgi:lysophospholipase L1-like esterase
MTTKKINYNHMKRINFLLVCFVLSLISINMLTARTKVACVGNSITGFHQYAYYATPLRQMLGEEYLVDNFGKGGSGVFKQYREELDQYEFAYINSPECEAALAFLPDIVIIKFGANDANMSNFTKQDIDGKQLFKDEYTLLINKFRDLSTHPQVFICVPPAMFYPNGNPKDSLTGSFLGGFSNEAMTKYIHPAIKELAVELNIGLVDFYTPTRMHPEYMPGEKEGSFPDWVHPDHRGHYVMALAAYEAIKGKPFERPFVEGEFIPDLEKEYYIRNRANGKVLTCDSQNAGTTMVLADMEIGAAKQLFKFENFSYNIYRIRHSQSKLQVKNAGTTIIIGDDPASQGTKYSMLITPAGENYHTIGLDDRNMIGGSSSDNTVIVGNKNARKVGEIDHWEFIEKGKEGESGLPEVVAFNGEVIGLEGKILFKNLEKIRNFAIYNLAGNAIAKQEIKSSSFMIDVNPGIYLVSLDDKSHSKIIVR